MRVVYVVGDGPLQGATYAMERRLPLNEEIELTWKDWPVSVYRVGSDCTLWFLHLRPQPDGSPTTPPAVPRVR